MITTTEMFAMYRQLEDNPLYYPEPDITDIYNYWTSKIEVRQGAHAE